MFVGEDWDELSAADPMGQCVVELESLRAGPHAPVKRWVALQQGAVKGLEVSGEIQIVLQWRLSFQSRRARL